MSKPPTAGVTDDQLVMAMLIELRNGVDDPVGIMKMMNADLEGLGIPWRVFQADSGKFKARKLKGDGV